jgi:hypothetical protein
MDISVFKVSVPIKPQFAVPILVLHTEFYYAGRHLYKVIHKLEYQQI